MQTYTIIAAVAENADGQLPQRASFNCGPSFDDVASYTVMPFAIEADASTVWEALEIVREDLSLQPGDVAVVDGKGCFQILPNTIADLDATRTVKALAISLGYRVEAGLQ